MIILRILATVMVADFASGFFHWLEDAYGKEDWPVTGRLITKPNIVHHHDPRFFTRHSWLHSSWLLLCICLVILLIAWLCDVLTWDVWLFVALGANANQIHKWAHRTPAENDWFISVLQRVKVLQTPQHHARHHTDPKDSHYCVLTDFLNPILDGIGFWQGLEWMIWAVCGVKRRTDESVRTIRREKDSCVTGEAASPKPRKSGTYQNGCKPNTDTKSTVSGGTLDLTKEENCKADALI